MADGYIIATDGAKTCPVDTCNAVCCRASHYIPGLPGPCDKLDLETNLCTVHDNKPKGCATYPIGQADIDMINRQAERGGFTQRCQLRFTDG